MKESQKSTMQTALNQRIVKSLNTGCLKAGLRKPYLGRKGFLCPLCSEGKNQDKEKRSVKKVVASSCLSLAYLLEESSRISVFNSWDNLGAPCSFHASVSRKAFFSSLVFFHSLLLLGTCQRASWGAAGLSVYRWRITVEPGAAAPLRNNVW